MCRIYMLGTKICQQCCESQQTDGFTTEVKVKVSGGYEIVFIVNVEEMEGSHHLKQLRLHMKCVIRFISPSGFKLPLALSSISKWVGIKNISSMLASSSLRRWTRS